MVLAVLAAVNLVLALLAVPRGLLAAFGIATPWPVDETLWSWCANGATYGLVGGLMVAEFAWRSRRFPGRYHGPLDFARRMAALGRASGTAFFADSLIARLCGEPHRTHPFARMSFVIDPSTPVFQAISPARRWCLAWSFERALAAIEAAHGPLGALRLPQGEVRCGRCCRASVPRSRSRAKRRAGASACRVAMRWSPAARSRWHERLEAAARGGGRFAIWLIRSIGRYGGRGVARSLLPFITVYFLLRRGASAAIRSPTSAACSVAARPGGTWRGTSTASPRPSSTACSCSAAGRFDVRIGGLDALHRALDGRRGVLLLGSHLGSFEVLRVLAQERPDYVIRVVLDKGHNPAMTQLLDELNPRSPRA